MQHLLRLHQLARGLHDRVSRAVRSAQEAVGLCDIGIDERARRQRLKALAVSLEQDAAGIEELHREVFLVACQARERVPSMPALDFLHATLARARSVPEQLRQVADRSWLTVGEQARGPQRRNALAVLLVDDDLVNRRILARQLAALGCRVDEAGNGREALVQLGQRPYQVVFMDLEMPGMDGIEATIEIRRRQPAQPPAIIGLTSHVRRFTRKRCIDAGMDDYLPKPATSAQLGESLARYRNIARQGDPDAN